MRSLQRSATRVYAALGAQFTALTALVVFEEVRGRRLAVEIASFGGDPDAPGARAVVGAVTVFAMLMMVTVAATIVTAGLYLVWLRRARRSSSAASVLAGCLLPGVNLVLPPLLADWAWQDGESEDRGRWLLLLSAWWASWLTALWLVLSGLTGSSGLTGIGPTELLAVGLSAVLCATTVREITANHSRNPVSLPASPITRSFSPSGDMFTG